MLVLNCPNDFHEKFYSDSTNQVFQSIPIFKKKTSFFDDNEDNKFEEEINKEDNSNSLKLSKKKSSESKNTIKKKKTNAHRVNEPTKVEKDEGLINIMKKMTHYQNNTEDIKIEDIMKNTENTENNIKFIQKLFYKLNLIYDKLIDSIIKAYTESIAKKIMEENKKYYEKGLLYFNYKYNDPNLQIYYEIQYEDIIYLFCSIIIYFTKLNVKLELGEQKQKNLMVIIYGKEEVYEYLADVLNYSLQLKPYAYKYVLFQKEYENKLKDINTLKEFNEGQENLNDNDSESQILNVSEDDFYCPIQFEDLKFSISYNFPPYKKYDKEKEIKFRRYEKNDLYHECQDVPLNIEKNCKKCTKFRNIDKLRLITTSIDKLLSLNYLKKQEVLIMKLFQRNYKNYEDKITMKNIFNNSWNIFSTKKERYLINLIRNFFGEHISYYYLYLNDYIKWLIPLSILGIIIEILIKFFPDAIEANPIGKTPITYIDIIILFFCVVVNIWIGIFIKSWKQKEKLYAYFWGTEYYKRSEPDREDFKPDFQKEFVFGEKLKFIKPYKRRLKQLISYLVLFIMMFLTCVITFGLLNWKQVYLTDYYDEYDDSGKIDTTPENFWHDTLISIIFAAINAIQIKVFTIINTYIVKKLNKWENYQKEYQSIRDLTIKLVLFEFTNNYAACFYIGFIKPNIGKQCAGTCMHEVEIQLYTTYAMFFALNFIEIGIPFFFYKYRSHNYRNKISDMIKEKFPDLNDNEFKDKLNEYSDIKYQSSLHQLLVEDADDMIYEYTEVIILFGFVCLFSSAAPLTPLIILVLVWTEKIVDLFKMFYLERFERLDKENGIGIYNFLMKILLFIGYLTNIGIVLFSKSFRLKNDLYYKILIFLCIENSLLIIGFLLNFNFLPMWFEYLTDLKELYTLKYFLRKNDNLPHLKFFTNKRIEVDTNRKISEADIF